MGILESRGLFECDRNTLVARALSWLACFWLFFGPKPSKTETFQTPHYQRDPPGSGVQGDDRRDVQGPTG
jgi:hypothetical protein